MCACGVKKTQLPEDSADNEEAPVIEQKTESVSNEASEPDVVPDLTDFTPEMGKIYRYLRDDGEYAFEFLLRSDDAASFRVYFVDSEINPDFARIYFSAPEYVGERMLLLRFEDDVICVSAACTALQVELTAELSETEISGLYLVSEIPQEEAFLQPEDLILIPDQYTDGFSMDAVLAGAVRESLCLEENSVLTKSLLEDVIYLYVNEPGLISLSGIELMTNLEMFSADRTFLEDISPLTQLKSLHSISIGSSYITAIPDLSEMVNLEELQLTGCLIEDTAPATSAPALKHLNLCNNLITSIAPLCDMKNLKMLNLSGNCILDYELAADCRNIREALAYFDQDLDMAIEAVNLAKDIVSREITDDMTDLEKEYRLYRYLIDNTEYAIVPGLMKPFGYTALKLGKGVCGHYSEAFTLLCRCAGLDMICVYSDTHAWNMIRFGENWYHVDALWDEGAGEYPEYFNVGTEKMMNTSDHIHDLRKYPIAYDMSRLEYAHLLSPSD